MTEDAAVPNAPTPQLPDDLDGAVSQALTATRAALDAGYQRLQVEIQIPEIKFMPIAEQFLALFADQGDACKVLFPDAGAAALARRDWGEVPCVLRSMFEQQGKVQPDDEAFLIVNPSSVEVEKVESICNEAAGRPVVLLLPNLEDIATIGIGVAGRKLRERFLSTLESCYFLKPLDGAAIFRCFPHPWQVWVEEDETYHLMAEFPRRPTADMLEQLFAKSQGEVEPARPSGGGLFSNLKGFLRALNQ